MTDKNIRIELPKKFHNALKRKAKTQGHTSKRLVAKVDLMRQLIKDGLVRPSNIDRQVCGLKED